MASRLWDGLVRGFLVGVIAGVTAGIIEGVSIVQGASVFRAALLEAVLYAVVVDGLAVASLGALVGALVHLALESGRPRVRASALIAIHLALVLFCATSLAGLTWAFRANGADPASGVPTGTVLAILGIAVVVAAAAYVCGGALAPLLSRTRVLAAGCVVGALALALVFPIQVVLESSQHQIADDKWERLAAVDLDALPVDFVDGLEATFDAIISRERRVSTAPPNVLLITVDALRADHVAVCGNDWIATPTINALARHAAVSCNTHPQQPQTNPALASLLTSTFPAVHGVRMHMVDRLADSFDTLAEILRRSGFLTAAVLPWTSLEPAFSGFHQGFETYEAFVLNEPPALQNPATAALAAMYRRVTNQLALGSAVESVLGLRQGTEAEIDGRADVTAAAAASWLSTNGRSRFFLWVHFFDPHYPWTPPEPWDQLYDQGYEGRYDGGMGFIYEMREGSFDPTARDARYLRALYASEVTYMDHYIGRMLTHMDHLGLLDNTIIVLTADHGESLGERGTWWPSGEYWLHGDDLYQTGTQVPLIVYDPRSSRGQQMLSVPIQHVDVMPTILDLLDIPVPRQAQGRSIVPLLQGTDSGADRFAVTTLGDDSVTAIIGADGWKLVVNRLSGTHELYYLPTDPEERIDLAGRFPDAAIALSRRLEAWALANQSTLTAAADDGPRG